MTLEEAWDATVSRDEALREVRRHKLDEAEFLRDEGDREEYQGADVLGWMGY